MHALSRQDRELLTLRGANMSTGSIAALMSWPESRVYNRLGQLEVTSAAEALARLEGPPLRMGGWTTIGSEAFAGFLAYSVSLQRQDRPPEAPAAGGHAPPRSATLRCGEAFDMRVYLEREIALSGDPDGDYARRLASTRRG
jgi:hypothetical protein